MTNQNLSCNGVLGMGKIQDKKEMKRKALLEAAYSLFSEKGIETSISDIVNAAGVAKGTFYLYFNDKMDILHTLVYEKTSTVFANAVRALEKVKVFNVYDEILYIANNVIDQLSDDPKLLEYFARAIDWAEFINVIKAKKASGDYDSEKLYDDFFMKYDDSGIKEPEIMVFMILDFVISSCYSPIKNQKPCTVEEIKPYIFNVITSIINLHLSISIEKKEQYKYITN